MGKLLLGDKYMIDNNLKYAREELEMTQEELGFVFGVSRKTISGWETANNPIPFSKLIKFCNLYDYSLDFIMGFTRKNTKYNTQIKITKKQLGMRLKDLRDSLNLSQQKFANKCGISQTTYSHYETGLYLITTISAYYICKKYNISMDYILGRINNIYRNK